MLRQPNFLIASGVAAGSSFLSAAISQHPQIYLPKQQRPEPGFFHYNYKYAKGITWYLDTWFNDVAQEIAIGERSSLYLPSQLAAERIAKHYPNIKLIFCLRNPIERAWGNYRFTVLEGLEDLSFAQAILQEDSRMAAEQGIWAEVQPRCYVQRGMYHLQLPKYFALFSRENILLIKSEQMSQQPQQIFQQVFQFLGVDQNFVPDLPENYTAPSVKEPKIQLELRNYFAERYAEIIEAVRKKQDLSAFSHSAQDEEKIIILMDNLKFTKDPLPDPCRNLLLAKFADCFAQLKKILPFSIEDWD